MVRQISILVLLTIIWLSGDTIADDFYFGGYMNQWLRFTNIANSQSGGEADSIKEELGFNSFIGFAPDSVRLRKLGTDKGFITFPTMNNADDVDTRDDWKKFWRAYYAEVEAEDDEEIGFYSTGTEIGGIIYGPTESPGTPVIFLDSLEFLIIKDNELGAFNHKLFIDYDNCDELDPTDSIAYLVIHNTNKSGSYGYALVDSFLITQDDLADSVILGQFLRPTDDRVRYKVQIGTYQRCTFGVDYYRFYNEFGQNLIEAADYQKPRITWTISLNLLRIIRRTAMSSIGICRMNHGSGSGFHIRWPMIRSMGEIRAWGVLLSATI